MEEGDYEKHSDTDSTILGEENIIQHHQWGYERWKER
jgi:hypothetical protein